jgi:hypothetical protein
MMNNRKRVCPNDDPVFTKLFYKIGMLQKNMSPMEVVSMRMQVYYCVCIIVRAAIVVAIYHWRNSNVMRVLVFIGAMIGVVNLGSRMNGTQWWSKKFQFVMSIIIVLTVIFTQLKMVDSRSMSIAMLASLIGGVVQSFVVGFC